jgi:hypothetical protein
MLQKREAEKETQMGPQGIICLLCCSVCSTQQLWDAHQQVLSGFRVGAEGFDEQVGQPAARWLTLCIPFEQRYDAIQDRGHESRACSSAKCYSQ